MDITKSVSGLGNKLSKTEGSEIFSLIGKLFPNADKQISEQDFNKMLACAEMLEKYANKFPKTKGVVYFEGEDMNRWKNDFYKNLVQGGPKLLDDRFYNPNSDSNLGVGNDGGFSAEELFQFMFRLYKAIALGLLQN